MEITSKQFLQFLLLIAGALAYTWLYEGWLSDDSGTSSEKERDLPKLNRTAERTRWLWANVAILIVFAETAFGPVHLWGVLIALVIVAAGYLSDSHIITKYGGELDLTPRQQATRRRFGIVPVILVLYKGTDFKTEPIQAAVLVVAALAFAVLILVPEPPL
jgi:hypothetical protein